MVAQYDTGGARQAWYTQSLARIDEVLNVVNESGKQWYQQDALGSVYGLTSASGALLATTNYDVFGALEPAPTGPAGQPFGFTGREHELDSGLVYARARFLNPAVGAWTSSDPAGFVDGSNLYGYVTQNPVSFVDPRGLAAVGDLAFFNWKTPPRLYPHHLAVVTRVDAAGNPTYAFGAWGDTMAFHEVNLNDYLGPDGTPASDHIIATGRMTGFATAASLPNLVKTWGGRPVAPQWQGLKGYVCIDVATAADGFGGAALRSAMASDLKQNAETYLPINEREPDSSDPIFYRSNPWLWRFLVNTNRLTMEGVYKGQKPR